VDPEIGSPSGTTTQPHSTLASSVEPASQSRRWWWIELWLENRTLFKEFIKHVLFFLALFGALSLFRWLFHDSKVEPEQLTLLSKVHFYMFLILLVIFAGSFIIKVMIGEYREIRK
jgi:hypothetical protein